MFIELAHYTLLFAAATIGLQTVLLLPTLWSKGSAVAIKLGFRGAVFSVFLLALSFTILMYSYAVQDFSVAVVFETFASQTPAGSILPAFISAREGYFFAWILTLGLTGLIGFSKHDLPTYQERGRYLFAFGALLFMLLILMLTTADPFVRIPDPPMEGLGLKPTAAWAPYTLKHVLLFLAFGTLAVGFIKSVCMFSKSRSFIAPTIRTTQTALILMLVAGSLELLGRLALADKTGFFGWLPSVSLEVSVAILAVGQLFLLYFAKLFNVFSNWIVFFGLCLVSFFSADFFAAEYQLFALNAADVYFPNPVIAACSLFGLVCFLLFFLSALVNKSFKESGFSFFSRESFIGWAAASCLSAGISIGIIALLPALFMFVPDLPLRLLPDLFRKVFMTHLFLFSVFIGIAFLRQSVRNGWVNTSRTGFFVFWGTVGLITLFLPASARPIVVFCLPALILLKTVLNAFNFRLPKDFSQALAAFRKTPLFLYGITLCTVGFLIFSAAFGTAFTYTSDKSETVKLQEEIILDNMVLRVEIMTPKTDDNAGSYRLIPDAKKGSETPFVLKGSDTFQSMDKKPDLTVLYTSFPTFSRMNVEHSTPDSVTLRTMTYPGIRLVWNGLFLMILGLLLMTRCWKREPVQ